MWLKTSRDRRVSLLEDRFLRTMDVLLGKGLFFLPFPLRQICCLFSFSRMRNKIKVGRKVAVSLLQINTSETRHISPKCLDKNVIYMKELDNGQHAFHQLRDFSKISFHWGELVKRAVLKTSRSMSCGQTHCRADLGCQVHVDSWSCSTGAIMQGIVHLCASYSQRCCHKDNFQELWKLIISLGAYGRRYRCSWWVPNRLQLHVNPSQLLQHSHKCMNIMKNSIWKLKRLKATWKPSKSASLLFNAHWFSRF